MPPKPKNKRKRQLIEEARKGREARKKLRLSMMSPPQLLSVASSASNGNTTTSSNNTPAAPASQGDGTIMSILTTDPTSTASPATITTATPVTIIPPPTESPKPQDVLKAFAGEWKDTLDQEDLKSLALFLCHIFTAELDMSYSRAAEHTAKIMGKTERTIRQWRSDLVTHGEVREGRRGRYERPKVLWANKELNDKVRAFVQANTAFMVQGKQTTMKVKDFRQWVNETLLPNQAMASLYSFVPGYGYAPAPTSANQTPLPQKISMETARKWLRELGF